jgi:MFS family permease
VDRWPRVAVIAVFFVHGFLFASWTAHIPQLKEHLGLSDGRLGLALLGAPIGSILAVVLVARILPRVGSRSMVRLALLGYCVSGPFIGLTGSLATFFVAFLLWGFFQGTLDVSMNTQAIAVEGFSGRVLMPGFHGSWSSGALVGAVIGAFAVGAGVSLSEQLLVLAVPMSDNPGSWNAGGAGRHGMLQRELIVLGGIAFADMLCEGAAADWAAVYLHNSMHVLPIVAGMGFAVYALAMLVVRLSGNRLFTRFAAHRLLPLLAAIATLGFAGGLLIARPVSVLVGFALLGVGLGSVIPMTFRAAGAVDNVNTGRAVASVAGWGWAGFVVGPVLIGAIGSATTLRSALFVIPLLTGIVAVGTRTAKGIRRSAVPTRAVPSAYTSAPAI